MTDQEMDQLKFPVTLIFPAWGMLVFITRATCSASCVNGHGWVVKRGDSPFRKMFDFSTMWNLKVFEHYLPKKRETS